MRLLNGAIEPTSERLRLLGLDPRVDGPALRARTGVLTETPSMDERLTAWDNLSIYADLYGVPRADVRKRINELLAEFDRVAVLVSARVQGFQDAYQIGNPIVLPVVFLAS